ncbi:MAG: S8 family serine peptidase [Deltaproteobacteria bacterium]|nr:S8 family serine peptidase [Deltaproteobacteria bacterium]
MARRRIARAVTGLLILALTLPLTGCDQLYDLLGLSKEERKVADLFTEKDIVKLGGTPGEVVQTVNDLQAAVAPIYEFEPLHTFTTALAGFQVKLPLGVADEVKKQLLDDPRVEYIVLDPDKNQLPPDRRTSTSPSGDEITNAIARIGGPFTGDLSSIQVAVIDTGVDLDHPDLNVVGGKDIVGEAGGEESPGGDDLNEHGTHVAGTIGAKSDGSGVAGVAPGVGIHAVRVLDSGGSGNLGDIIAGLEYVLSKPEIKVVNMSLGGAGDPTDPHSPLKEAIDNLAAQGVVVCIAAGNESENTNYVIPAGYDSGIVVSAYDTDNSTFADFSNYGSAVDIAAPGVEISSTVPGGGYANLSGTSMATPHVAGAAAAYLALHPGASVDAVRSAIVSAGETGYDGQGGDHPENLLNLTSLLQ